MVMCFDLTDMRNCPAAALIYPHLPTPHPQLNQPRPQPVKPCTVSVLSLPGLVIASGTSLSNKLI